MDRSPSLLFLTRTPTRVSYQIALFLILAAAVFALFFPFSRRLIPTDQDALAAIAQIRSTGSLLGWENGFSSTES